MEECCFSLLPEQKKFVRPSDARPSMREASCRCSSAKKLRRDKRRKEMVKLPIDGGFSGKSSRVTDDPSSQEIETALDSLSSANESPALDTVRISSRSTVLQACTLASGVIATLGVMIRDGSHVTSAGGLPVVDCTAQVSFGFEMWYLEFTTGLVVLISSSRYLLLKAWPDFSESSEAAYLQVLTSLDHIDYLIVAYFPGISEEILFCGALQPIFVMNWASIVFTATLFCVLHLGDGWNYSFAIRATFVGLAYGYATMISSSM